MSEPGCHWLRQCIFRSKACTKYLNQTSQRLTQPYRSGTPRNQRDHNGWIDLDVEDEQDWSEIGTLAQESYRHFALKWMVKNL